MRHAWVYHGRYLWLALALISAGILSWRVPELKVDSSMKIWFVEDGLALLTDLILLPVSGSFLYDTKPAFAHPASKPHAFETAEIAIERPAPENS